MHGDLPDCMQKRQAAESGIRLTPSHLFGGAPSLRGCARPHHVSLCGCAPRRVGLARRHVTCQQCSEWQAAQWSSSGVRRPA